VDEWIECTESPGFKRVQNSCVWDFSKIFSAHPAGNGYQESESNEKEEWHPTSVTLLPVLQVNSL